MEELDWTIEEQRPASSFGQFWAFLSWKRFKVRRTEGLACRNGGEAGLG